MRLGRRTRHSAQALALIATLGLAAAACAHAERFVATVARPTAIPLARSPGAASLVSGQVRQLDINVLGFQPAVDGPVQVVVEARNDGATVEIGRFGLYPERGFSAAEPAKTQRFALTVPAGLRLSESTRLVVRILPTRGSGQGASVEVEPALLH
jgi:hypothetical protein